MKIVINLILIYHILTLSGELQESTGIAVTGMDTHNRGPNDLHTGSNKPYFPKKKGKKLIKTRKKKTKNTAAVEIE